LLVGGGTNIEKEKYTLDGGDFHGKAVWQESRWGAPISGEGKNLNSREKF